MKDKKSKTVKISLELAERIMSCLVSNEHFLKGQLANILNDETADFFRVELQESIKTRLMLERKFD